MTREYINQLLLELATGNALEHSYRPALKSYVQSLDSKITAVNEPSRSAHGAPDFAFYKTANNSIVLGYVETKDIYVNLDQVEKTEQLRRYLGYANLILTNYIEFRFFRNGIKYQTIEIAKQSGTVITPIEQNYNQLELEIKAFLEGQPETITSARRLAEIMGGKAARIRENVIKYLQEQDDRNKELNRIYEVMRKLLVHDLSIDKFADMYAQTLVYGLFVARYYDETPENFTRSEARDLIPASNPFLQHFFDHIAGASFDPRLKYIVDELCDVFAVSAIRETVAQHYNLFGEAVDKDPVIHFYEDFLKEYDPELRKNMGAYYTPVPVVKFIIHAVDDLLKKNFGLQQGLADTSKIEQIFMQQGTKAKRTVHKVQLLDPAVGTATFLNETVKFLFQKFKGQEGVWESYVENELLPRMHGFELMMAPYTIAHLKLALTFRETGIDHFDKRLGIYLTNTLEAGIPMQIDFFDKLGLQGAISEEAHAASEIKQSTPIMVILGNPPYSVSSSNKGEWIEELMKEYKTGLNERNIQPLSDDYIKFIRFAEYYIEKNGSGIIAMITNNSFIDGLIHRQMRKHLLETFDDIYIYDLHGSTIKREKALDGSKDQNIFDIQQGVSINLFVKNIRAKKKLANVFHSEIYGTRQFKFEKLKTNEINSIPWTEIETNSPDYFFTPTNRQNQHIDTFNILDIFPFYKSGLTTEFDDLVIQNTYKDVANLLIDLKNKNSHDLAKIYSLDTSKITKIEKAINDIKTNNYEIHEILYRPLDKKWTLYTGKINGLMGRPRRDLMKHFFKPNLGLVIGRQGQAIGSTEWNIITATNSFTDCNIFYRGRGTIFPLYLYDNFSKVPNLETKVVNKIEDIVGKVSPEDIFDYIYGILHSRNYRIQYKDYLKYDFPRIPYPKDKKSFEKLGSYGTKLRQLHLLEDSELSNFITTYPISGDNLIEKVDFQVDRVFINDLQFFGGVPKEAWDFYIGGYQPAQKWLKDRKGRKLTYEDITLYQKIIKSLVETIKIMLKVDEIYFILYS
jgi:predicted helicase